MKENRTIRNVLIIVSPPKAGSVDLGKKVYRVLKERGLNPYNHSMGESLKLSMESIDLAIVLGGDGTVLYSARLCTPWGIPLLPVNLGTFGFLAEVGPDRWEHSLDLLMEGKIKVSRRAMLEVVFQRKKGRNSHHTCLNDCVLSAAGIARLVRFKVCIAQQEFLEYRADGVIFSTPTGSTAYSMAAGGPILHPELAAVVINPINPFSLSNRPLLVPLGEEITASVLGEQRTEVVMTLDGQDKVEVNPGDQIIIRPYKRLIEILGFRELNFYEVVRKKMNWKGGLYDS